MGATCIRTGGTTQMQGSCLTGDSLFCFRAAGRRILIMYRRLFENGLYIFLVCASFHIDVL